VPKSNVPPALPENAKDVDAVVIPQLPLYITPIPEDVVPVVAVASLPPPRKDPNDKSTVAHPQVALAAVEVPGAIATLFSCVLFAELQDMLFQ